MQTMCRKSTSVTEQTLYLLRIQTDPCISLQPFFIFKTCVPLFLFCGNAKRKSEHKKFWKRIGGAGGKERTFFKRFFLPPCRRGAAGMRSAVALWALEPPASASLRRGKPAATSIQYLGIPCASNPPVLPCKHSTFFEYKRLLAFPFSPSSFTKLVSRFFILRNRKMKKRT